MSPLFFPNKSELHKWFTKNHLKEKEFNLGYYKVGLGKPSISWSESVDVALCYGWIDGVRRSIDADSYMIRFTPRKPSSIWSTINIAKVGELIKQGLMRPEGLAAFEKRKEHRSKIYSYESEEKALPPEYESRFKANKQAWEFFKSQAPSYQKTAIHLVVAAKQEVTREKRIATLISDSEAGQKIKALAYNKSK
jgi:uncharacterized protein YdeI (YjbR/CyaY-like superfamily)